MAKTFTLSSSGIKNIICDEKEFVFIFGNKEIRMSNISAEFISPIVSRLHVSDSTINSIYYELPQKADFPQFDAILTEDIINLLHLLSKGSPVSMNPEQIYKIQQISILLSNSELFNELQKINNSDENLDEYLNNLQLLEYLSNLNYNLDFDISSFIIPISKKFNSIDHKKLHKLSKPLLLKIISNENLKIEDEDSLFDFIKDIFEQTNNESLTIIDFFEFIDFRNLSEEKFKEAIQCIDPNQITNQLWKNICSRFLDNNKDQMNKNKQDKSDSDAKFEINEYKSGNDDLFNGIMHSLSKKTGGNISNNGTIEITCTSAESNRIPYLVDYESESVFYSSDSNLATIRFDFKDKLIQPSSYKVKTAGNGKNYAHPKNWVIEVSNDGEKFIEIDRHENDSTLNGPLINVKQMNDNFYRFIQFRQTGKSWHEYGNNNQIAFRFIDFYGKIKLPVGK